MLPQLNGSPYVFFAPHGGMLADMSVSAVMRRMHETDLNAGGPGYLVRRSKRAAVPQGLRSSFRDWDAEAGVDHIMAELCLVHTVGTTSERAYRRTYIIKKRRQVLCRWGDFIRGKRGEVVAFGAQSTFLAVFDVG